MKKIINRLFSLLLIGIICFGLISCGGNTPDVPDDPGESGDPTEEHNISDEWSYNETYHYHECLDIGCSETFDTEVHRFTSDKVGNVITYTCSICGYSYTDTLKTSLEEPTTDFRVEVDGLSHNITEDDIDGFDANTMTLSGEVSGILVGTYTITITLKDTTNYEWENTEESSITLTWSIVNSIAPDPGYSIDFGTVDYNPNAKLSDYSLDSYANLTWADPDEVPSVKKSSYLALYNPDSTQYSDYYVYVSLKVNKIDPTYESLSNVEVVIGSVLSTNSLPEGYSWKDSDYVVLATDTLYEVIYTPSDTDNYNTVTFNVSVCPTEVSYTFTITCSSGDENAYTITENGDEYTITFGGFTQKTVYSIKGELNGNIVVNGNEDYKFELELNGVTITTSLANAIYITNCDKATISAKKGTSNVITDNRSQITDDTVMDEACVYAECDLEISGKGELTVTSVNNYGIKTKDDLDVKNLTLSVTCLDNALKGNDSVTIESGTITLIAKQGDGIKTSNSAKKYEDDGVTLKKIQGTVSILAGEINIYAACDGIDASYNVEISGSPVINIYTDKYSEYSETVTTVKDDVYYIKSYTYSYKYSIYYYNSDTDYKWVNSGSYTTVQSSSSGMGPSRPDQSSYNYQYEMEKPSGYSYMILYIYSSSQTQGQATTYTACTQSMTLNNSMDTIQIQQSRYGSSSISYSWTSSSQSSYNPGMGGGMQEGNQNTSDYSTKGIKADNEILISGGVITIKAYDDAIHTNTDVVLGDEDDLTDDYYGTGNITISGGEITVSSLDDGIHADGVLTVNDGVITVTTSYEGLEGTRVIINGGTNSIIATDDGINATATTGEAIVIAGGVNYVYAGGDGVDSNSKSSYDGMLISGGYTVVINTSSGNSCLDTEAGYKVTGGCLIGIMPSGGMTSETTRVSGTYTQKSMSLSTTSYLNVSVGGTVMLSLKVPKAMSAFMVYFGTSSATFATATSTSFDYDANNVYWNK